MTVKDERNNTYIGIHIKYVEWINIMIEGDKINNIKETKEKYEMITKKLWVNKWVGWLLKMMLTNGADTLT